MRLFTVCSISCFAIVLLAGRNVAAQDKENSTNDALVEHVVESLKRQEAAIKSLSVTIHIKKFNNFPTLLGGGGHTRSSETESWHIEPSGRGWADGTGTQLEINSRGSRTESEIKQQSCFDGTAGVRLTTELDRVHDRHGLTAHEQTSVVGRTTSPLDITLAHQGKPIHLTLIKRKAKVVGTDRWRDRKLTILETEPIHNNQFYKSQYWVDIERGFTIARRINLFATTEQGPWTPSYSVNAFDYEKTDSQIWLPTRFQVRSYFGKPADGDSEPPVALRIDGTCADWSIDQPLKEDRLTIDIPRSVRVRKLGGEPKPVEIEKLQNFFVSPVATELQRELVGKGIDAFGVIDVTSFVNVHTKHIEWQHCDFDALQNQFQKACVKPNNVLRLKFDFGSLGTNDTLGAFVRTPIEKMAKDAGFGRVRSSSFYHGDALFLKPAPTEDAPKAEKNIGDENCDVFPISTSISKYILGDFAYYLKPKRKLAIEPQALLDDDAIASIKKSIADREIDRNSVLISLVLGGPDANPMKLGKVLAREQGSPTQLKAVKQLRELGFGDIKIVTRLGFDSRNCFYRH